MTTRPLAAALILVLLPGLIAAAGYSDSGEDREMMISIDSGSGASLYIDNPVELPEPYYHFSQNDSPKVLIVHADPVPGNLTGAAREHMAQFLLTEGWEVEIRSLYDENFNPVASAEEISFQKSPGRNIDPQVAEYQDLIRRADALVLVYPLWWKQPPAMMKGWQDRVFTYGFAYEFVNNSPDSVISLLSGKKILIINVVASSREIYEDQGYLKYLDMADASLYGLSGMDLSHRHIIYSSTNLDMDEKKDCLDELSSLISLIEPAF